MVMPAANHRKKWLVSWTLLALATVFADIDLDRYERALSIEDENGSDPDVDIFVAEILPEGVQDLEQMFQPLARYKKAVIDAQIETVPQERGNDNSEFVIPTLQGRNAFVAYDRKDDYDDLLARGNDIDATYRYSESNGGLQDENGIKSFHNLQSPYWNGIPLKTSTQMPTNRVVDRNRPLANFGAKTKQNISGQSFYSNDKEKQEEGNANASGDKEFLDDHWSTEGSGSGENEGSGAHKDETNAPPVSTNGAGTTKQYNKNPLTLISNGTNGKAIASRPEDLSRLRNGVEKNNATQIYSQNEKDLGLPPGQKNYFKEIYTATATPYMKNAKVAYTQTYQSAERPKIGTSRKTKEQVGTTGQLSTTGHVITAAHVGTSEQMDITKQPANNSLNAAVRQGAGTYIGSGSGEEDSASEAEEETSGESSGDYSGKRRKPIDLRPKADGAKYDQRVNGVFVHESTSQKDTALTGTKPSFEKDINEHGDEVGEINYGLQTGADNLTRSTMRFHATTTPSVQRGNTQRSYDAEEEQERYSKSPVRLDETTGKNASLATEDATAGNTVGDDYSVPLSKTNFSRMAHTDIDTENDSVYIAGSRKDTSLIENDEVAENREDNLDETKRPKSTPSARMVGLNASTASQFPQSMPTQRDDTDETQESYNQTPVGLNEVNASLANGDATIGNKVNEDYSVQLPKIDSSRIEQTYLETESDNAYISKSASSNSNFDTLEQNNASMSVGKSNGNSSFAESRKDTDLIKNNAEAEKREDGPKTSERPKNMPSGRIIGSNISTKAPMVQYIPTQSDATDERQESYTKSANGFDKATESSASFANGNATVTNRVNDNYSVPPSETNFSPSVGHTNLGTGSDSGYAFKTASTPSITENLEQINSSMPFGKSNDSASFIESRKDSSLVEKNEEAKEREDSPNMTKRPKNTPSGRMVGSNVSTAPQIQQDVPTQSGATDERQYSFTQNPVSLNETTRINAFLANGDASIGNKVDENQSVQLPKIDSSRIEQTYLETESDDAYISKLPFPHSSFDALKQNNASMSVGKSNGNSSFAESRKDTNLIKNNEKAAVREDNQNISERPKNTSYDWMAGFNDSTESKFQQESSPFTDDYEESENDVLRGFNESIELNTTIPSAHDNVGIEAMRPTSKADATKASQPIGGQVNERTGFAEPTQGADFKEKSRPSSMTGGLKMEWHDTAKEYVNPNYRNDKTVNKTLSTPEGVQKYNVKLSKEEAVRKIFISSVAESDKVEGSKSSDAGSRKGQKEHMLTNNRKDVERKMLNPIKHQGGHKVVHHKRHKKFRKAGKHHLKVKKSRRKGKNSKLAFRVLRGRKNKNGAGSFITNILSKKARELYKTLIHDTSRALMSKKRHKEKRRKHHMSFSNPGLFADTEAKKKFHATKPEGRANVKGTTGLKSLATNILSTMVANDQKLVEQAKHTTADAYESIGLASSRLDTQNSLVERLAEMNMSNSQETKEIPLPMQENEEDLSLKSGELENENPGKTVLQKQSKVGLGSNFNLDNLDGTKASDEYKTMDQEIEGEQAMNEKIAEESVGTKIGKMSPNQDKGNASTEHIPFSMSTGNVSILTGNSVLSSYNSEESLGDVTQEQKVGNITNVTTSRAQQAGQTQNTSNVHISSVQQNDTNQIKVQRNESTVQSEKEKLLNATEKISGHLKKQLSLYFAGNSSLWKNHPIVSMNIDDLVHEFYKVNHENLTDLVEHPTRQASHIVIEPNVGKKTKIKDERKAEHHKERNKHKKALKKGRKKRKGRKHRRRTKKLHMKGGHFHTNISVIGAMERGKSHSKLKHRKDKSKKMSHLKRKHRPPKQKYKAKIHKHVKGIAKFGISGAVRSLNSPEVPTIKNHMPANVKYFKIGNAAKHGAVCIDGSTPGYYFRSGQGEDRNKWIIHLHGGAWCYDAETCYRRSKSILGSTRRWSAENITNFFQGFLSDKNEVNPWFKNWNVVVQSYCDGGLFSGRRIKPLVYRGEKLYFRGRQILKAMIETLKGRELGKASDIILSGTSAGGLAVLLQGDYLRHKLPKTAEVRGLIDAGFFLESQSANGTDAVESQFKGLYDIHAPKIRTKCERSRDNSTRFKCLLPQNMVQYTKLPLYFVNSLYDHWQLSELHGLRCIYNNDKCAPPQRDQILEFRNTMYNNLKEALKGLKHYGLFADSCIGHGQAIVDYTWSRIRVNNQTLGHAFSEWIRDKKGEKRHWNVDCHFPCNGSCPRPLVKSCIKNFEGASQNHRTKRYTELC